MKRRAAWLIVCLLLGLALTVLWHKTQSINPEEHSKMDTALRELRSLDRTINQDVLRARYQLVDSYMPVLRSYRRIEQLEATISRHLSYLDDDTNHQVAEAVAAYRAAVTAKQDRIERFKYRSADLKELLNYLPGAGTGIAQLAREVGEPKVSVDVNRVLQLTLLYNLTSDESYAPTISKELDRLLAVGEKVESQSLKRRVRSLVLNIRRLLKVKPDVDHLLVDIFEQPVTQHEEVVASVYYRGYSTAEQVAQRYRMALYGLSIALFGMVAYSITQLQRSAKALALANEKLEERVLERTRELDARNREMRVVLDNVEQALFTVDMDGVISRERSRALDRWFPNAVYGTTLWGAFVESTRASAWFELGWDQLREDFLPMEMALEQLPREITIRGNHYSAAYIPVTDDAGKLERVLLVISDVTERVAQAKRDAEQQEQSTIFRHILRDRTGFLEFFAEGKRLVEAALTETNPADIMRAIHTVKGNASIFGITSIATLAGELESKIVERREPLSLAEQELLSAAWSAFSERVKSLTDTETDNVEITRQELDELRLAIKQGATSRDVLRFLRNVEREPVERRFARISEQAKALSRRLGKGSVLVATESNDVRLDAERWAPFWAAFVHMIRNALDHGIETEEERIAVGKSPEGHLWLSTQLKRGEVIVEIRDDGRGIDWDAVRAKAHALGILGDTEEELVQILFRGGLSTKHAVSEFSGRGAGVSACYSVCLEMGGTTTVESTKGKGTTFRFAIPSDDINASLPPTAP